MKLLTVLLATGSLVVGLLLVMVALGDKIARWGGYAEALPFLGLFALFLVGNFVVMAITPRRRMLR